MRRLANIALALALLGGTSAAFAVSERLKLERSPVTAPDFDREFSPVCGCPSAEAVLRLRFRRAETVDAAVVGPDGEAVRALVDDEPVARGVHAFVWDGRDDAGAVVPDGRYRLRVHLEESRRTILVPTTVLVDTRPPRLTGVRVFPTTISPDADGRGDRLRVTYRASERHRAQLRVDGEVAVRGRTRPRGRFGLRWAGRVQGAELRRGEYELVLEVTDVAGNVARSEPVEVRIRFVEIVDLDQVVEPGGELAFAVDTEYDAFRFSLHRERRRRPGFGGPPVVAGEGAATERVSVSLPPDLEPGRYQLRVVSGERKARAVVLVVGDAG